MKQASWPLLQSAPSLGGNRKGEGSVLGFVGVMVGGDYTSLPILQPWLSAILCLNCSSEVNPLFYPTMAITLLEMPPTQD